MGKVKERLLELASKFALDLHDDFLDHLEQWLIDNNWDLTNEVPPTFNQIIGKEPVNGPGKNSQ